jgi:hypothetical protein
MALVVLSKVERRCVRAIVAAAPRGRFAMRRAGSRLLPEGQASTDEQDVVVLV